MFRELTTGYLLILCALLLGALFLIHAAIPRDDTMTIFRSGKGKGALIETPYGALLVDPGPDASVLRVLGASLPPWERHLAAIILSGTPSGSAERLLDRYTAGSVLRFGANGLPYGNEVRFADGITVRVDAPGLFSVLSRAISSTTDTGTFLLK
ncbi:MAG TPA: hypothetical protein VFP46_00655 [Candidatus Paceibacterota bacterium]|nr:hypothetical protein [Candidatus Paceibacterota bacterium]